MLIAAKAGDKAGIAAEMGNLYYHLMVMMVCKASSLGGWGTPWTSGMGRRGT